MMNKNMEHTFFDFEPMVQITIIVTLGVVICVMFMAMAGFFDRK